MKINSLKGTNMDVTDAIRSYLDKKIKAIEKLVGDFEPVAEISIEVAKTTNHHAKGPFFKAEMMVKIPGELLRAEESAEDLYEAIDSVKDQILRQIKRVKGKMSDRGRRAGRPGKE